MKTQEISDYVNGLSSATLAGTEELYLDTDEKCTVDELAEYARQGLESVVVEIGDWNMDTTGSVIVSHGLADHLTVVGVDVIIFPDANTTRVPLVGKGGYIGQITSTTITLFRIAAEWFDGSDYDSTSFNRGKILITYTV